VRVSSRMMFTPSSPGAASKTTNGSGTTPCGERADFCALTVADEAGLVRSILALPWRECSIAAVPSATCHFQNSLRQSFAGDLEARQFFGDLAEIVLRQFEFDSTKVLLEAV
jgi:hypothetical protein